MLMFVAFSCLTSIITTLGKFSLKVKEQVITVCSVSVEQIVLYLLELAEVLHGPSMLPDKAKFVECCIISLALSFWMKHLVIGQLQKPAKFSAFYWSPS